MTIFKSVSVSLSTSQSTVMSPTSGCRIVLRSSAWPPTAPSCHRAANRAFPSTIRRISRASRGSPGYRAEARRRSATIARSDASRFSDTIRSVVMGAGGRSSSGKRDLIRLRSSGAIPDGSPSSAAQPRFHQISRQSAVNTETGVSPSRVSTRWTPGGMWSLIIPSAGGRRPDSAYR
jgi:hypothetical protein